MPQESYQRLQGFSVMLNVEDAADAECIFNSLSQNGAVQMPLQETFLAMRFGMLVDQFGTGRGRLRWKSRQPCSML